MKTLLASPLNVDEVCEGTFDCLLSSLIRYVSSERDREAEIGVA